MTFLENLLPLWQKIIRWCHMAPIKEEKSMDRELLKQELHRDEALVKHAYKDSEGYLTIGIGRLIDKRLGGGITEEEAYYLLENDITSKEAELVNRFPAYKELDSVRQRAVLNMAFNLGIPRLMKFKKMLGHLQQGNYHRAAEEALDSKWATQVGDRALRIAKLISDG